MAPRPRGSPQKLRQQCDFHYPVGGNAAVLVVDTPQLADFRASLDDCRVLTRCETRGNILGQKDGALPSDASAVYGVGVQLDDECRQTLAVFNHEL